jgi:subfamily B ATP-binding cassette protein MsbA
VPTERQVADAIYQSQCDFIDGLPWWLSTEIGEKGIRLSWWQRQRLAIAKIFLKNPHIILLDEPTSALDSLSEELITKVLDRLFIWRTVIIIAHRLQTVKKADEILVIDDGDIVERWTHEQLISHNWKYKKMLDLQSGF